MITKDRARTRDALRVLAYAVEQGYVTVRPSMVEVRAANLSPVEQDWLVRGISPCQLVPDAMPNRVTVEGNLLGRLVRVHLPLGVESQRIAHKAAARVRT